MRSGNTLYSVPLRESTPSILMVSVPAPETRAPILFRQFARSMTSGSRAAFSISVTPSASAAAIIRFSVPVTVTISMTSRA